MEISCQQTTVKLFDNTKPPMRRIYGFIEPLVYDEIVSITQAEELEFSATVRELMYMGLRYYKFKKGTLNKQLERNKKMFFCQICNQETSTRKQHSVVVMYEEFRFCEECFFADKYKKLLIAQISRL